MVEEEKNSYIGQLLTAVKTEQIYRKREGTYLLPKSEMLSQRNREAQKASH